MSEREVHEPSVPVSILIVDDNEKQLLALESILSGLELEIVSVTSGRAALRELLRRTFALVLLDVNMPGLDGFEIASLIRQRRECQSTPIIFMTAYGDDVYVERGYSLGAVDFMLTPIVPEVLRTKVAVFIELHRQTERVRKQARRLEQRATQLASLAKQLTIAEERERRRVARLLHDDVQQLLAAAMMVTRNVGEGHPHMRPALEQLQGILMESLEASRSLAREVSPPILQNGGLIAALMEAAEKFQAQHGLPCTMAAPDFVPRLNDALEAFLYHAIGELLLNVTKHARARAVRIVVASSDEEVSVGVEDDGVGFESGTLEMGDGSHFGLQSIRQRLELFDGCLDVRSVLEGGAAVYMTLPLVGGNLLQDADHQSARQTAGESSHSCRRRFLRLLIVDDHEMIRRGLRSMLAGDPEIEVVGEACDGCEAVNLTADLEPDVVLMDLFMPGTDGLEATRELVGNGCAARVVAMSTSDEESVISSVLEAGAAGFLSKTCSAEQLVSAIRTAAP